MKSIRIQEDLNLQNANANIKKMGRKQTTKAVTAKETINKRENNKTHEQYSRKLAANLSAIRTV
jgi:hypothetical protein